MVTIHLNIPDIRQADGCLPPRLSLNLQQTAISLALDRAIKSSE